MTLLAMATLSCGGGGNEVRVSAPIAATAPSCEAESYGMPSPS